MGEAVQTLWEMAYGRCSQAVEGSGVGVGMKTDGGRVKTWTWKWKYGCPGLVVWVGQARARVVTSLNSTFYSANMVLPRHPAAPLKIYVGCL